MSGNLILIRGLPGSGKSTLAKEIMDSYTDEHEMVHFEADMFFINDIGEYKFVPCNIAEAHSWCLNQTKLALKADKNVIVSNTFVKLWEMSKYRELDCESIAIYETTGTYDSIHGVPENTINRMRNNWEKLSA